MGNQHSGGDEQGEVVVRAEKYAPEDDQDVAPIEQIAQRHDNSDGDEQRGDGVAAQPPQAVAGKPERNYTAGVPAPERSEVASHGPKRSTKCDIHRGRIRHDAASAEAELVTATDRPQWESQRAAGDARVVAQTDREQR